METKTLKISPKKEIFSLCIAIILVFFLLPPSFGQPHPKLKVMASLFPLQEFASAVGGDRVQATLLLPPGAEAHTWEPRPSDVAKIAQADIFIYIGPSMEPWVDKVLQAAKGKRLLVVEVSRGIPLLKAEQGEEGRIRSWPRSFLPGENRSPYLVRLLPGSADFGCPCQCLFGKRSRPSLSL